MISHREYSLPPLEPDDISAPGFETHVATHETYDGLRFDVAVTQNETDPSTPDIIVAQPWSGFVDRDDVRDGQMPIIAMGLGARVITIDSLGIGNGTSKIPASMHQDLRHGNFDPLAAAQWEALAEAVPDLHDEVSYFGYSQGATLSAWLAKNTPDTRTARDIMLVEAVGLHEQSFARLIARYGVESAKWYANYLTPAKVRAHTPNWMPKPGSDTSMGERMRRDISGFYDYPRGLARARTLGALATALDQATLTPDTHIALINNARSGVSTDQQNERFALQLAWAGYENIDRITVQDHSHGMIDDPTAMYAFLEQYRNDNPV